MSQLQNKLRSGLLYCSTFNLKFLFFSYINVILMERINKSKLADARGSLRSSGAQGVTVKVPEIE